MYGFDLLVKGKVESARRGFCHDFIQDKAFAEHDARPQPLAGLRVS